MRRVQTKTRRQVPAKKTGAKPLPRKIHIGGKVWSYRITGSDVWVRDPENVVTTKINHSEFTGVSWDILERLEWKQRGYRITPADVKDFIENGLKPVNYGTQDYRFMVSRYKRPEKQSLGPR